MIIGLTGGIGSGKSTIADQLSKMGYAVYNTDREAKRIIQEDPSVRTQIEHLLGKEAYANGRYQTAWVAQKVFADAKLLERLNALVHPAVKADILHWAQLQSQKICIVECAILYSSGIDSICDKIIEVSAPEEIRLQRTISRDKTNTDKVRKRMSAQEKEMAMYNADFKVINDGKLEIMTICLQIQDFFCNFAR